IAGVIQDLCDTGRSSLLEKIRSRYPPGTAELSQILSLPRIRVVHEGLGITTLADLRQACVDGRVRKLPGFGAKSESKLIERIDDLRAHPKHVILPEAMSQARALREHFV